MHTALPLLAEAVATIVKQSANSHFKQQSRDILNVLKHMQVIDSDI